MLLLIRKEEQKHEKIIGLAAILFALSSTSFAQENENNEHMSVPAKVKSALKQKYPEARNVGWEKENGNYEANWAVNLVKTILFSLRHLAALLKL